MTRTGMALCGSLVFYSGMLAAENFSYNQLQLEANNTEMSLSGLNDDDAGYAIAGTLRLPRSFYLAGHYETAEISNIDFTNYSAGIGAFASVSEGVDLFGELAYVKEETDYRNVSLDDGGAGLTLGVRGMLTPFLEAEARYRYADFGSNTGEMNSFQASGMYKVTDMLGVGLKYRRDDVDETDAKRTVVAAFVRASF
ncbi:MAG TPA: hypothetical protein VK971_09420 [Thiohalobacter sp.]|nr:hypothetical protein [Thiohalobacter sp.]